MKKVVSTLVIFMFAMTMSFAETKKEAKPESKEVTCNKTCAATFKQCEKDAKGDKAKKASCVTAKKNCNTACKKEKVKEETK